MTTLTLAADATGIPFVDVLADDFDAGVASATVVRTAKGRDFKVRGLVDSATSGVVTTRDYEAPLGVESSYRVQQFDSDGLFVGWSDAETVTLPAPPTNYAWFHNPFDPSTSVRVAMLNGAAGSLQRPNDLETFRIPGRSVGVTLGNGRQGLSQVVLDCYTATDEDADRFDALFGGYDDYTVPIVCVRTSPAMRLPPTLFAAIGSPAQSPIIGGGATWALTGDETAPPVTAFITPLLDYADFTAFYTDYAAFTAAYADYTEATRDYSIAGTA